MKRDKKKKDKEDKEEKDKEKDKEKEEEKEKQYLRWENVQFIEKSDGILGFPLNDVPSR